MSNRLSSKISLLYTSKKLPWIIIGLGVVLRVIQYLFNRSLWFDESMLALNIIERSFLELLQPLSYQQGAPVGFLMLEKTAVQIFNSSEYALRLLPFLSGIASIVLFYEVAKRLIKPEAVPIAVFLFAISEPLIYYSSEVKQYSIDVFIALSILYFVTRNIQAKRLTARNIIAFGILGAIVIWFSHPSVFILAGAGVSLAVFSFVRKDWARIGHLSIAFSFWALSLILCYLVSLADLSDNQGLLNYWGGAFMPFPPSSLGDIKWFFSTFFELFDNPVGLSLSGIAALAFLVGSVSIFVQKKEQFFFLVIPILLTLLASGFHLYPFQGRLLLFLVPSILLFIAEGAEQIRYKTRHNSPFIGITLICLLFLKPSYSAGYHLIKPRTKEEIKPVISYLREHEQSGDLLYVYYSAVPAYKFYSNIFGLNDNIYIEGVSSRDNWGNYIDDIDKLRGNNRVWLLFSHVYTHQGVNEEKFFLNYLDRTGTKLDASKSVGASVYLYDLNDQ